MTDWKQIETAPKGPCGDCLNTVILLSLPAIGALKDPGARRVYEGRWNELQKTFTSVNGVILLSAATHWMPLPEPFGTAGDAKP